MNEEVTKRDHLDGHGFYVNRCGLRCVNFKDDHGPLSLAQEEWWLSFGRHLEAARRDWDGKR